ncbi:MAG: M48 family metalloprotease [Chitinophagales bacterium]|jgi:predicted Zn-dependent protease|nr:M48 family metalloprotease [Chitinophagales bacterium]
MMKLKTPVVIAAFAAVLMTNSCSEGGGINIFSLEDDIALGAQIAAEIESDPTTYPILDSADYATAYGLIYDIRDRILASGKVYHKDDFEWQIRIINNDEVVNAFCTPGGYIYVYTGLIKYLEDESQLAGVLGHEMAHADLRHSTDQLTEAYGISLLISIVLGEQESVLADVAASLTQLAFSRGDESQADEYSVIYLCPTDYIASGSAGFFVKVEEEGGVEIPEFLSTHPNPDNRIENINTTAEELACEGEDIFTDRYDDLLDALP